MAKDLRTFLEQVKQVEDSGGFKEAGYQRIDRPVKPYLEVQVIQQKLARAGRYPVIYCDRVEGSDLPLASNLWGSWETLGLAVGADPAKWSERGLFWEYEEKLHRRRPTKLVPRSRAPVKEVVLSGEDVDLGLLPIPQHAVPQGGKYITAGCMICKDPDTGIQNVGVYRHQVQGKDFLGCMINPGRDGAYIAFRHAELGRPMEVAIFLGHHPAVGTACCAHGSLGKFSELEVAGGFLGEPLEVVKGETVDLEVPARAELVIEGVIDEPRETSTDGPFPELNNYGRGGKPVYVMRVTAITMRKDAIYHDLDPSHREHRMMGGNLNLNQIYGAVKEVVPTVREVRRAFGMVWVRIKKRVEGEGKRAALAALHGEFNVHIAVAVDEDINLWNESDLGLAMSQRLVADRGIVMIPRILGSHLNPTSYNENRDPGIEMGPMATKLLIDATRPLHQPWHTRITPQNAYEGLWETLKLEDYGIPVDAQKAEARPGAFPVL
ncbi:MAG: UbiD family decarboxylase [Chloroflexi bacterium]|nr:UbiD family decarboxylase [Chloroflexota bacterium]